MADGACGHCGSEVRTPGALGRELRRAMYERELSWAASEGLCRRTGFRGIHGEVGPNPDVQRLHDALWARVVELPTLEVQQAA